MRHLELLVDHVSFTYREMESCTDSISATFQL